MMRCEERGDWTQASSHITQNKIALFICSPESEEVWRSAGSGTGEDTGGTEPFVSGIISHDRVLWSEVYSRLRRVEVGLIRGRHLSKLQSHLMQCDFGHTETSGEVRRIFLKLSPLSRQPSKVTYICRERRSLSACSAIKFWQCKWKDNLPGSCLSKGLWPMNYITNVTLLMQWDPSVLWIRFYWNNSSTILSITSQNIFKCFQIACSLRLIVQDTRILNLYKTQKRTNNLEILFLVRVVLKIWGIV